MNENDLDFEQGRLDFFQREGINPYPPFITNISFAEFKKEYSHLEPNQIEKEVIVSVAGRVIEKRNYGKKLFFYTVMSNGENLQYLVNINEYDDKDKFAYMNNMISRGDIVGAHGYPGKSKTGELSIYPKEITLLSPFFKEHLPKQYFGLGDLETRVKKRYFDMIVNTNVIKTLKIRSKVIKEIRNYLDEKNFIELQTPILTLQTGGANAKPFVTHHNDLDQQMYLRIAPELFLKQLVVGGIERVYEIGQQFRNEAIDMTHVCEFTSLEFYMAYSDYYVLMDMCENMLAHITKQIHGTTSIKYLPAHSNSEILLDFQGPYKRIDVLSTLQERTNTTFPEDLTTDEANVFLDELCKSLAIDCSDPRTTSRLVDKLIGYYIEPECIQPTFVMNHPLIMSPLAKNHRNNPKLTERFELFVCGMELANAYTELNNHVIQQERFMYQQKEKNNGDGEVQSLDPQFIDALKCGLPPTGGFGLGIERFIMFLSNNNSIREVLPFPPYALKKEKSVDTTDINIETDGMLLDDKNRQLKKVKNNNKRPLPSWEQDVESRYEISKDWDRTWKACVVADQDKKNNTDNDKNDKPLWMTIDFIPKKVSILEASLGIYYVQYLNHRQEKEEVFICKRPSQQWSNILDCIKKAAETQTMITASILNSSTGSGRTFVLTAMIKKDENITVI